MRMAFREESAESVHFVTRESSYTLCGPLVEWGRFEADSAPFQGYLDPSEMPEDDDVRIAVCRSLAITHVLCPFAVKISVKERGLLQSVSSLLPKIITKFLVLPCRDHSELLRISRNRLLTSTAEYELDDNFLSFATLEITVGKCHLVRIVMRAWYCHELFSP
jgi:hypothetical protein